MTALAFLRDKASSEVLAQSVKTNPVVIRRILADLSRAGLIHAERGKSGGSSLVHDAENITLLDIYRAVMGEAQLLNLHDNPKNRICPVSCKVRKALSLHLQNAQQRYEGELAKVRLADVERDI